MKNSSDTISADITDDKLDLTTNLDSASNPSEAIQANSTNENSDDMKYKADFNPLIFFSHPILPYSSITINNPNRNDIFLGLALKYGKLTAIDEETTNIEDITVFFEKEDPAKKKEILSNLLLGTVCKLSYNKQRLIIEGTEKINRIKSVRQGKYKSYKAKDAVELAMEWSNTKEYAKDCEGLLANVLAFHQNIINQIDFKENQFNEVEMKFPFDLAEIKNNLESRSNNSTLNNSEIVIDDVTISIILIINKL